VEQRRTYLQRAALPSELIEGLLTKCELQISEFSGRNLQESCSQLDLTDTDQFIDSLSISGMEDILQPGTSTQDTALRFCESVESLGGVMPTSCFEGNGCVRSEMHRLTRRPPTLL
jgi:hypothetical protein